MLDASLPNRHSEHALKRVPAGVNPVIRRWFVTLASASLALLAVFQALSYLHSSPWLESSYPVTPAAKYPDEARTPGPFSEAVKGCKDVQAEMKLPREKAAILVLGQDKDLEELLPTMDNFESKFNSRFEYPYVFLNDVEFSEKFKDAVREKLGPGRVVEFGVVPPEWWSIPEWVGEEKAREAFKEQGENNVQYATKESYHHMCRFYSGLFAKHPLMLKYNWYWRLEPGVRFYCDITYDPFRFLAERDMVYGFTITIVETPNTIPTLFQTMLDYRDEQPGHFNRSQMWEFFLKPASGKEEYNMCHFWTNFEIGSLNFFRGKEYQDLFDHLDRKGGFYLERWGDAPIRSLALGMLADFDKVHYFEDLAYKHDWFVHCSKNEGIGCNCECPKFGDGNVDIDRDQWYTCLPKWNELNQAW